MSEARAGRRRGRTRTRWDERAEVARAELLEHAIERIIEHGVGGIAAIASPSALARSGGTVSVDTAYRLLGSSAETLGLIVERIADPGWSAPSIGWPSADDVTAGAVDAFEQGSAVDAALHAFRYFLERNFFIPAKPFGLVLDGVAMTASDAWHGPTVVADADRGLAVRILEQRRRSLEQQRDAFRWMLRDALASLRRRPRPGMTIDLMVALMHALADGAVNRMLIWPGCLTIDDVARAVLDLGLALSEDGSLVDPRLPDDPAARDVFTRIVTAADASWARGDAISDLSAVAAAADAQLETVAVLFVSVEEVADSVVRTRVVTVGVEETTGSTSAAVLTSALQRLAAAADAVPQAVMLAAQCPGDATLLGELTHEATELARHADRVTVEPERFAEQLIAVACNGMGSWETASLLLDLLRRRGDGPSAQ